MKSFLKSRSGINVRLIFAINQQKQPTQYFDGQVLNVGEDAVMIKDPHIGEVAVSLDKILAVQIIPNP